MKILLPLNGTTHSHKVLDSQAPEGLLNWLALSTHGNGGFQQIRPGSVTDQLARQAGCPVLVVPPACLSQLIGEH